MKADKEERELVLVTGGSGFVGSHCILQLLQAGYRVRTTVRSLGRSEEIVEMMRVGGIEDTAGLSFVEADLTADEGWADAVRGCEFVLHVASPFPATQPDDEDDLIVPAREGTLRVLRAAREADVKRVVVTSSFAAIGFGDSRPDHVYTEEDWTDPDAPQVRAYVKSKTLAERAAWEFMESEGGDMELAVVNPVMILGPALSPDLATSVLYVKRVLDGSLTSAPFPGFSVVDVRDVADLHLRAMTDPAAAGERFLAVVGEPMSLADIARVLKDRMGDAAADVADIDPPDPDGPAPRSASNDKARRVLGWDPHSREESVVASARSLIELGMVPAAHG